MHSQVTDYIQNAPEEQRAIMETIRALIHQHVPNVIEEFKWGRPVFKLQKVFAYLKPTKAGVSLGFMHYQKINDPNGLLEGTGKDMRHIKLKASADIDQELLGVWFKEATAP